MADETTKRRVKLGLELQRAREAAGMTQARAAAALGCQQAKINKIEAAKSAISPDDLAILLKVYDPPVDVRNEIRLLAAPGGPRRPAGMKLNVNYLQMLELEPQAREILSLHSERLPSLLQSELYLLRQYVRAGNTTHPTTLLRNQLQRTRILDLPDPPRYRALLSESSLHRMPGGRKADVVVDQAQHLLALCERHEHLSVQIVTYEANLPFFDSDVTILKFAGARRDVAYVEYAPDGRIFKGVAPVAEREKYWHEVEQAALTRDESRKYLNDLVTRARNGWRPGEV